MCYMSNQLRSPNVESLKIKPNPLEIANKFLIHLYFNEIEKKTIQKLGLCVRD